MPGIEFLLSKGADLMAFDGVGLNAIGFTVTSNRVDILKNLLNILREKGVKDPQNMQMSSTGTESRYIKAGLLHLAVHSVKYEVAKHLIEVEKIVKSIKDQQNVTVEELIDEKIQKIEYSPSDDFPSAIEEIDNLHKILDLISQRSARLLELGKKFDITEYPIFVDLVNKLLQIKELSTEDLSLIDQYLNKQVRPLDCATKWWALKHFDKINSLKYDMKGITIMHKICQVQPKSPDELNAFEAALRHLISKGGNFQVA